MRNNNKARISAGFAVRTRLELATYGVTGRYSNQLNYRTRSGLPFNGRSGLRPKGLNTRFIQNRVQRYCFFLT